MKNTGASQQQIEAAFATAIEKAYPVAPPEVEEEATAAAAPQLSEKARSMELKPPASASEAQEAFRAACKVFVSSKTIKLVNFIIEDRACVFRFDYSRVYAVGLAALCDAFLKPCCVDEPTEKATRAALCFSLGLDAETVWEDAKALTALAKTMSPDELLASEDFVAIAAGGAARPPKPVKYTYALGTGLAILMRATGETVLQREGKGYENETGNADGAIDRWCKALNLNFATRLAADVERPVSIDGVGRFSFETESGLQDESLVSIGAAGQF